MEHEEGQPRVAGALGDDLELPAEREVVVVPVEDDGVRHVDLAKNVVRRLTPKRQLRVRLGHREQLGGRRGIDRGDLGAGAPGPVQEHLGERAAKRADLEHGPRPGRIETRQQRRGDVRKRVADEIGVGLARGSFHLGAAPACG